MKSKSARLIVALLGVIVVGGGLIAFGIYNSQDYIERKQEVSINNQAQEIYLSEISPPPLATNSAPAEGIIPSDDASSFSVDWKALNETNSDIYAWLAVDTTTLSYPVLKGNRYLYRDYKGESNECGSLFTLSKEDFTVASNVIIYGHHIPGEDSMFSKLFAYKDTESYVKEHSKITIYTPTQTLTYTIFSVLNTNVSIENGAQYTQSNFSSKQDVLDFAFAMQKKSLYEIKTEKFPEELHLLTLSTCDRRFDKQGGRLVVMAYLSKTEEI